MYRTRKKIILVLANVLGILLFGLLTINLLPRQIDADSPFYSFLVVIFIFIITVFITSRIRTDLLSQARRKTIETGETTLISEFIDRLRFCYTNDDLFNVVGEILENKGDCSIIYYDRNKNYLLYNSPDRLTKEDETHTKLLQNFPETWPDGIKFFDRHLGVTSRYKKSRGFFIVYNKMHFFVFCKYSRLFDLDIYDRLYEEFKRFVTRSDTLLTLSEISATTKEWEQLAVTQQSFLPQKIPNINKLKIATYFRPLVNVSGDYFSILPIDQNRTLLMLGDVSGKGLPAALLMGLVINTVKIIENKSDLVSVVGAVDKAIKGMHLQDKYTVLFLGIVDTAQMTIRYINASMSDPVILSPAPDGYRIKPLTSNCSVIGILELDLDSIQVAEKRLFRGDTILMATDGVSEVMNDEGVELGDTEIFKQTLQSGAAKSPQEFVDDIVDLIMEYNGDKKLHDDVTMMIAKVGY